jgi:hypothetical protein
MIDTSIQAVLCRIGQTVDPTLTVLDINNNGISAGNLVRFLSLIFIDP